jgi:threonine aldolase
VAHVNLYSDTQTRPSAGMRRAIAEAEVGDEQRFQDPTVHRLQERVAELLGHEAGLFVPSGTLCNQIALRLHSRPGGDELILDRTAHPIVAEAGGPAWNAGLMIHALDGDGGIFTAEQVRAALRPKNRYFPRSRVVSVEQTTNMGGGRVWPLERISGVLEVAREQGLRAHMDGARLLNAVVASGVPAADYAGGFDTAWLDFSKGLGAPVGAVRCGSRELIEEAWRWKQMMGGALRQAGIVAAGCLYALDHNVERLAEDHEHARLLADGLRELGLDVLPQETNIVIAEVDDPQGVIRAMAEQGVEISAGGPGRIRCVTHLDVDRSGVERGLEAFRAVLGC